MTNAATPTPARPTAPLFDPARAERLMRAAGADLLLASRRPNVAYLTDCFGIVYWDYPEVAHCLQVEDDGCAEPLFYAGLARGADRPFVVAHHNRVYVFRERAWASDVRPWCARVKGRPAADVIGELVEAAGLGGATIGVEMGNLPATAMDALRARLPRATFIDADPIFAMLRTVKTPAERERQRQAYRIGEAIYAEVIRLISRRDPGLKVRDVRAVQMSMATRAGCPPLHFGYVFPQNNVDKFAWHHDGALDLGFDEGDAVLLDLGLIWRGYTTDFGRNLVIGKAPVALRDAYDGLKECRRRIARMVVPGVRVDEFFAEALTVRAELGLPPCDFLGHSLGIECVEHPCLIPSDTTIIEEGMTLVVELSVAHERIAFLLEDAGVVTAEGWRTQSAMSDELVEVM